jgi:putative Mn2+ efflux pump MntP
LETYLDFLTTFFIAIGLAMDCFAVSLGIGTSRTANAVRPIFRLSFHFGLFQGLMTLLGWLAGSTIAGMIASFDHWVAFVLLAWVGIRMIREGLGSDKEIERIDPSRGRTLVILSIATSIDALAVGLSMAMLNVDIVSASLVIGFVTLAVSLTGLLIGHQLGVHFGKRMEILGGVILNGIGLRVLLSHLL